MLNKQKSPTSGLDILFHFSFEFKSVFFILGCSKSFGSCFSRFLELLNMSLFTFDYVATGSERGGHAQLPVCLSRELCSQALLGGRLELMTKTKNSHRFQLSTDAMPSGKASSEWPLFWTLGLIVRRMKQFYFWRMNSPAHHCKNKT